MSIQRPTLIINKDICQMNIRRMTDKANQNNIALRPHFKTHQSIAVAEWFKEAGINKITVSSLQMALYFANAGWQDITVAFPINIREIDLINELVKSSRLNLLFENPESVSFLSSKLRGEIGAFIKIDCGYHRTGIEHSNYELLSGVVKAITNSKNMKMKGLLTHSGHSYKINSLSELEKIHNSSKKIMLDLKQKLAFDECILSMGDTPSCSLMKDFNGFDEMRPGNFVFYDAMQCHIGSCSEKDVALALACPVVAKHPSREELVIYGGGVHLSKEMIKKNDQAVLGYVCLPENNHWGEPIAGAFVSNLSQEHGIVKMPASFIDRIKVGELLYILPVHSCLTAQCMGEYFLTDGTPIDHFFTAKQL